MAADTLASVLILTPPHTSHKPTMRRNTGALGPLLIMMQNEQDTDKLRGCLDTLAFLLLDKANRKVINEIHGLDVIMGLFSRTQDPTVLCSALDAVCSLVRSDDADKVCVCVCVCVGAPT